MRVFSIILITVMAWVSPAFANNGISGDEVADVMECAYSDRANLQALKAMGAEPDKAQKKLTKRLAKFDAFLESISEDERASGEAVVENRRAVRAEEAKNMSAVDLAVRSARSKPPCESAEKIAKKAKGAK